MAKRKKSPVQKVLIPIPAGFQTERERAAGITHKEVSQAQMDRLKYWDDGGVRFWRKQADDRMYRQQKAAEKAGDTKLAKQIQKDRQYLKTAMNKTGNKDYTSMQNGALFIGLTGRDKYASPQASAAKHAAMGFREGAAGVAGDLGKLAAQMGLTNVGALAALEYDTSDAVHKEVNRVSDLLHTTLDSYDPSTSSYKQKDVDRALELLAELDRIYATDAATPLPPGLQNLPTYPGK